MNYSLHIVAESSTKSEKDLDHLFREYTKNVDQIIYIKLQYYIHLYNCMYIYNSTPLSVPAVKLVYESTSSLPNFV